jgi:Tfp pilus assembly protein PilX
MGIDMKRIEYKQTGSALIISLLLLLAITVISVAAMKNTMMDESMARNIQNETIAFQVSDTVVNRTLALIREDETLPDQARDARAQNNPDPTRSFADIALTNPNYDRPADDPYRIDKSVTNSVRIEHSSYGNPRGSCANYDCPFTAHRFNVTASAKVSKTHAAANILQNAQKEPYLRDPDRTFTTEQ